MTIHAVTATISEAVVVIREVDHTVDVSSNSANHNSGTEVVPAITNQRGIATMQNPYHSVTTPNQNEHEIPGRNDSMYSMSAAQTWNEHHMTRLMKNHRNY